MVEQDDPVGQGVRLLQIVGREEHRAAGFHLGADLRPEAAPGLDVQPDRRLVEKQQVRIAAERESEEKPLALAARKLAEEPLLDPFQAGHGEGLPQRQRPRVVAGDEVDVLADLEGLGYLRDLQHGAGPHPRRRVARLAPEEARRAAAGAQQPEQQMHRRGFARAVGAEHREHLARPHLQIHGVERRHLSIPLGSPLRASAIVLAGPGPPDSDCFRHRVLLLPRRFSAEVGKGGQGGTSGVGVTDVMRPVV